VIAGWPDFILLAPTGIAHFLELKRGRAPLTGEQQEFADWCAAHGVPFAIARNFDEALRCLKTWGAVKNGVNVHGR
jgi:predicted type IV restriction endonuclease